MTSSDDKVGWRHMSPEFRALVKRQHEEAASLANRLKETPGGTAAIGRRVTLYQLMRDTGVFPPNVFFYLIAWELGFLADERWAEWYGENAAPITDRIYREHGLDPDDWDALENWEPDPYPAELKAVEDESARKETELRAEVYREFGEDRIADLFLNDPDEFQRRWAEGQEFIHGPDFRQRLEAEIAEWLERPERQGAEGDGE